MSHWPPSQVGSCKQNNRWARERNRKNAVENTYVEQKWHYTASDFFTFGRCFDDIVQKVMASFNFIPVEEVGLGKLEFIQVILNEEKVSSVSFKSVFDLGRVTYVFHEWNSNAIQCSKQPTTSRILLIGQWLAFGINLIGVHVLSAFQHLSW